MVEIALASTCLKGNDLQVRQQARLSLGWKPDGRPLEVPALWLVTVASLTVSFSFLVGKR